MRKDVRTKDPARNEASALRAWERTCARLAVRLPAAGAADAGRTPRRPVPLSGSRWRSCS